MCLYRVWLAWGDAWMNKKPFMAEKIGIAYMLAGDTGASNIDPYAEKRTSDNQWIAEGAHIMVLLPDPAQLDALPTDPNQGGPYVMWKGTPYAHIMVPPGERPPRRTGSKSLIARSVARALDIFEPAGPVLGLERANLDSAAVAQQLDRRIFRSVHGALHVSCRQALTVTT